MAALRLRIPWVFATCRSRPFSSLRIVPPSRPSILLSWTSLFHSTSVFRSRKPNDYFSSEAPAQLQPDSKAEEATQSPKRKTTRSPAAKNSLRRLAVEAQRSRDGKEPRKTHTSSHQTVPKVRASIYLFDDSGWADLANL